jgi:glycerophosphoryl diester phosphodiesterase
MGSSRNVAETPRIDATNARLGWGADVGDPFEGAPTLIAHRGFAGENPENTLPAFRAAASVADWVEMDVRPTADDDPVVFHDHRLGRLTDLSGTVAETPTGTLLDADLVDGRAIPTLAEAFGTIPSDTGVVLDLKGRDGAAPTGEEECWEWLNGALATAIDVPQRTLLSTFWEGALAVVGERAPELPTAYVLPLNRPIDHGLAVAERHDCVALHLPVELLTRARTTLLERAWESGLAVNAWTVTDPERASTVADAGVDGIIADYPDVLEPVKDGSGPGDEIGNGGR